MAHAAPLRAAVTACSTPATALVQRTANKESPCLATLCTVHEGHQWLTLHG